MITVLDKKHWHFGGGNLPGQGCTGQVTKCADADGIVFYVRENLNAISSFQISSGERWGDKCGKRPRRERQSLELFAPDDQWDRLAMLVNQLDPLHRPVLKNREFSDLFVNDIFSNNPSSRRWNRWW